MNIFPRCLTMVLMLVVSGLSATVEAEQKSLKAIIAWDGEGRVFQVGSGELQFLGAFEGVMYVETAEGKLDEGFVRCPVIQKIEVKSKKTTGSGSCMIIASGEDKVYAEWT